MLKGTKRDIEAEFQENWELPTKYADYAREKGFDQERINLEFENFCLYYQEKGTRRKSWRSTWKRWIINSLKWDGNNNTNRNVPSGSANASPIDAAAEIISEGLEL